MGIGVTRRAPVVLLAALLGALAPHAVVFAQPTSGMTESEGVGRPYRGLFGARPISSRSQSLVLTGSVHGAYDDNVLAGLTNRLGRNWRLQRSGYYGAAQAGLHYGWSRAVGRSSFDAAARAQLAYFRRAGNSQASPYYQATFGMRRPLSRSMLLAVRQRVSYSPTYNASFVPVVGAPVMDDVGPEEAFEFVDRSLEIADPDLEILQMRTMRAYSTVSVSQRLGRNTILSGGYRYRRVDFLQSDEADGQVLDYQTHSASAGLSHRHRVSRNATLNLGYGIRMTDRNSPTGQPRVLHQIDAGVSYSRALSFSRRTHVSFATGSAVAMRESLSAPDANSRTLARLTGNASLAHQLGRTWSAQVSYRRGFVFREDAADEFYFADSVTASLGGLVNRRLSVSAASGWATSSIDRPGLTRNYRLFASAQATYGLTRYLAVYTRYLYYAVSYGADVPLDGRLPRTLDRQGVRVGLSTAIPLIR